MPPRMCLSWFSLLPYKIFYINHKNLNNLINLLQILIKLQSLHPLQLKHNLKSTQPDTTPNTEPLSINTEPLNTESQPPQPQLQPSTQPQHDQQPSKRKRGGRTKHAAHNSRHSSARATRARKEKKERANRSPSPSIVDVAEESTSAAEDVRTRIFGRIKTF